MEIIGTIKKKRVLKTVTKEKPAPKEPKSPSKSPKAQQKKSPKSPSKGRKSPVRRPRRNDPIEDDTEYESNVVDEAFVGKWFPEETNRQARGGFVVDDNAASFTELQKALQKVPEGHSVLVVPQLTVLPGCMENNKWGWVQTGMGPHYGSLFTMATCRHEKRILPCVQKLAEEGKLWCAVLAAKTMMNAAFQRDFKVQDDPPYWLVSLHKVVYTVPTQKAYKTLLEKIAPDAIDLKRNDHHRLGDLFYPTQEAEREAKRYKIPEHDFNFWGKLEHYNHCHVTNRHFVQSKYNPNQVDRLHKDVKYVKHNRPSPIHVGRERSHKAWKKEAFSWRDSGIQFYDERYGVDRKGCGLQPHGGLVPMPIFRKCLLKGETLAKWAEPRRRV